MVSQSTILKKRFLSTLIPILERNGCHGDVLYINEETLDLNKDKTGIDSKQDSDEGVKLRVFDGERYHEQGVSGYDEEELLKRARALGKIKKQAQIRLEIEKRPLDSDYSAKGKINTSTVKLSEKLKKVNQLYTDLSNPKLLNVRVFYEESRETRIFVNRFRRLSQEINGSLFVLVVFIATKVSGEGGVRYHYKSHFDHGWEVANIPKRELKEVLRFAERIARAERIKPGKYLSLLTPAMSGLLAHESFGHGMEADTIYKGRALAKRYLGKRIARSDINIADSPLIPGAHGFFFFDDEGRIATETLMVKKGIVNYPLTDSFNAAKLHVPRTSNGRCESFDHKVYARMTNTYFLQGTHTKKELLSRIKDGLILHNASGGMEDPKGWGIQIQGVVAERVKNGKPTGELYYEVGLTGYLPTVLKNIIGVSEEFEIPGTGRCGKGHHDWVRVAEGGPYLLIKDMELS